MIWDLHPLDTHFVGEPPEYEPLKYNGLYVHSVTYLSTLNRIFQYRPPERVISHTPLHVYLNRMLQCVEIQTCTMHGNNSAVLHTRIKC